MKEQRIIAFIGIYGNLIMSNISKGQFAYFWMALAIFYTGRYLYLSLKS